MPRDRLRRLGEGMAALAMNVGLGVAAVLTGLLVISAGHRAIVTSRPAGVAEPPPVQGAVRVEVLNGCAVSGAARAAASVLRAGGRIDVVEIGNAPGVRIPRSLVLDRVGARERAAWVASVLGVDEVLLQRAPSPRAEVTLVVGYDGGRWEMPVVDR